MAYVRRFAFLCLLCVVFVCQSLPARAGTITVCSSGCTYTDIQAAIDAARFGDTILLRAGQTYVGHYKLRAKAGTGWITIRSDASASLLPAPGTRLVPSDRPGANTSLSLLPRLVGRGGQYRSAPLLRTDPGAHGYRIQYIDFDGVKNVGWESLMYLGEFGTAANAYDLELDHVYIHGHKYKGQKRAIALNSGKTSITDSYIADIKNVGFDTQAIACWNGTGPYTITNNHLEAAGENVMFGGTDPAVTNRVPADATFRRNLFTKPVAWRNEILSAPAGVTAAAQTGGALAAGTHYFKVVALMFTGPATAVSRPSAEVRATVSSGGKVTVSWSGVTGADKYRIYRGTAAGGEKVYIDTPGGATSFAYTGRGETAKTPAASGTMWTVKNIFELKNAERITLDGNILENIWAAAQFGYAIVLTPRNSNHTAPWARVKDIVFTNNLVRHASGIANISAYDDNSPSGRTTNVTFRNNVFQDIDRVRWGGNTMGFLIQNGPTGIVIDHNTNLATSSAIVYAGGAGGLASSIRTMCRAITSTGSEATARRRAWTASPDIFRGRRSPVTSSQAASRPAIPIRSLMPSRRRHSLSPRLWITPQVITSCCREAWWAHFAAAALLRESISTLTTRRVESSRRCHLRRQRTRRPRRRQGDRTRARLV